MTGEHGEFLRQTAPHPFSEEAREHLAVMDAELAKGSDEFNITEYHRAIVDVAVLGHPDDIDRAIDELAELASDVDGLIAEGDIHELYKSGYVALLREHFRAAVEVGGEYLLAAQTVLNHIPRDHEYPAFNDLIVELAASGDAFICRQAAKEILESSHHAERRIKWFITLNQADRNDQLGDLVVMSTEELEPMEALDALLDGRVHPQDVLPAYVTAAEGRMSEINWLKLEPEEDRLVDQRVRYIQHAHQLFVATGKERYAHQIRYCIEELLDEPDEVQGIRELVADVADVYPDAPRRILAFSWASTDLDTKHRLMVDAHVLRGEHDVAYQWVEQINNRQEYFLAREHVMYSQGRLVDQETVMHQLLRNFPRNDRNEHFIRIANQHLRAGQIREGLEIGSHAESPADRIRLLRNAARAADEKPLLTAVR